MEGGGGGEKRERLPASPTILENAPLYFTVRLICKLTARQKRSMTNRLPLDYQICKITLFSNRTRFRRLEKLYSFFFGSRPNFLDELARKRLLCNLVPRAFPSKNGWAGPGDEVGLLCRLAVYVRSSFLGVELLEVGSSSGSFGIDGRANMLQLLLNLILPRCSS